MTIMGEVHDRSGRRSVALSIEYVRVLKPTASPEFKDLSLWRLIKAEGCALYYCLTVKFKLREPRVLRLIHPLEEEVDSEIIRFYADAEVILPEVERRGLSIILRKLRDGTAKTYSLDGMTELEEAELTDGQGSALSAHKSRAYERYAKRTMHRALAAIRKRHAHRLANAQGTSIQNEGSRSVHNAFEKNKSEHF